MDDEVADLKVFLDQANNWVEAAGKIISKKKGRKLENMTGVAQFFGPEKTINNLRSLLVQVYDMQFDTPEIQQLETIVNEVQDFQNQVRILLDSSDACITDFKNLLSMGLKMEIGMEELLWLDARIKQCQWELDAANLLAQSIIDIRPVNEMMKKGFDLQISEGNHMMNQLKDRKAGAEEWKEQVQSLLKSKDTVVTIDEISDLKKRGATMPTSKAIMIQLEKVYASVKDWCNRADRLFAKDSEGKYVLDSSANFQDVKRLAEDAKSLPVTVQMPFVGNAIQDTEQWLIRGKRTLGKTHSVRTFAMMLEELATNVEACTSFIHNEDVYCVCRQLDTDGAVMIECEICKQWYHLSCVKVSKKATKTDLKYECPICRVSFDEIKSLQKFPILMNLRSFLKDGAQLKLVPTEVEALRSIVDKASAFQIKVKEVLAQRGPIELTVLKNYLRCAEGLNIIIEPDIRYLRQKVLSSLNPNAPVAKREERDFCICKTHDDKPTTCCAKCDKKFHLECMGLTQETMLDYICSNCQSKEVPKVAAPTKSKIIIKLSGTSNVVTTIVQQAVAPSAPLLTPYSMDKAEMNEHRPQRKAATKPPEFYSLQHGSTAANAAAVENLPTKKEKSNVEPPKKKQRIRKKPVVDPILQDQMLLMQQQASAELYLDESITTGAFAPPPPMLEVSAAPSWDSLPDLQMDFNSLPLPLPVDFNALPVDFNTLPFDLGNLQEPVLDFNPQLNQAESQYF